MKTAWFVRWPAPPGHKVPRLRSCHPVNGVPEPDFIGRKLCSPATLSPGGLGKYDGTLNLTPMGRQPPRAFSLEEPRPVAGVLHFAISVNARDTRQQLMIIPLNAPMAMPHHSASLLPDRRLIKAPSIPPMRIVTVMSTPGFDVYD